MLRSGHASSNTYQMAFLSTSARIHVIQDAFRSEDTAIELTNCRPAFCPMSDRASVCRIFLTAVNRMHEAAKMHSEAYCVKVAARTSRVCTKYDDGLNQPLLSCAFLLLHWET